MAQELASKLFDSLHEKIMRLPDFCDVYPAHGAGSLCGRAMGAKRTSTIGYERKYNSALQIKDRDEFIASLTTNMPAAPDHFSRCSAINAKGPSLVRKLPIIRPMEPDEFETNMKRNNCIILDARDYEAFGGMHIENSYHVDHSGNFPTFCGWILPPDKEILLVTGDADYACEASVWLRRVGLDNTIGYLDGSLFAWAKEGKPTKHVRQLSADELHDMMQSDSDIHVVDVRAPGEYEAEHIEGAINIPAPDLRTRYEELLNQNNVVAICSTGHRSSIATSLLMQRGFKDVYNVAGGMTGYSAAGFAKECPMCVGSHGPRFLGAE
jgi:rhodanese-related sulfurtransferase